MSKRKTHDEAKLQIKNNKKGAAGSSTQLKLSTIKNWTLKMSDIKDVSETFNLKGI